MAQIDFKECTIFIQDADDPVNEVEVKVKDGTLQFTEKQTIEYVKEKGKLGSTRLGDEEPMDIKLDILYDFIKSSSGVTVVEAIKGIGGASAWVSTGPACEKFACKILFTHDPLCSGVDSEIVTISPFRWEQFDYDPKAGMISCSGKANVKQATVERA